MALQSLNSPLFQFLLQILLMIATGKEMRGERAGRQDWKCHREFMGE
jgi:hypothetical protein